MFATNQSRKKNPYPNSLYHITHESFMNVTPLLGQNHTTQKKKAITRIDWNHNAYFKFKIKEITLFHGLHKSLNREREISMVSRYRGIQSN